MSSQPEIATLLDLTDQEEERLRTLERTELLDSAPEELFDRYVRIAAQIADVPISMISLIDRDRQWFKASEGVEERETPRAWAFCDHAIRGDDVMTVEDATQDARFRDNPLVNAEEGVRFYVGVPLKIAGYAIGTLCVLDRRPRELEERQTTALTDLAAILMREIETNHLAEVRADRAAAAKAAAIEIEHQMRNTFSKVGAVVSMTAREDLSREATATTTLRRIMSLSRVNEIAMRTRFADLPMSEVAEAALEAAARQAGRAPTLEGPLLYMTTAAASVVAPVLDDLAYDALRRGVLMAEDGVHVSWREEGDMLLLRWAETTRSLRGERAFDSDYLQIMMPRAVHGTVTVSSSETGATYELRLPLRLVVSSSSDA